VVEQNGSSEGRSRRGHLFRVGPEDKGPMPEMASFLDRQFEMWAGPAPYRAGFLTRSIILESHPDKDMRPGKSQQAREWEAQLADILTETPSDALLDNDPLEEIFERAEGIFRPHPESHRALGVVRSLYFARMLSLDESQRRRIGPPDDVVTILTILQKELPRPRPL
jgi:hypothetical protein